MELIKKIKYFIQRGKRGYSDRDVWSVDCYLATIIPPMLRDVAKYSIGHPANLRNFDEWKEILHRIADGFEKYAEDEIEMALENKKEWNKIKREFIKWFGAYWT